MGSKPIKGNTFVAQLGERRIQPKEDSIFFIYKMFYQIKKFMISKKIHKIASLI